jgi:hypothetical protein
MPARYPETDQTAVHFFTFVTSPQEVKPGIRKWTRVAPDRWRQEYPDGSVEFSKIEKRIHIDGCDGSVIVQHLKAIFRDSSRIERARKRYFYFEESNGLDMFKWTMLNKGGADMAGRRLLKSKTTPERSLVTGKAP